MHEWQADLQGKWCLDKESLYPGQSWLTFLAVTAGLLSASSEYHRLSWQAGICNMYCDHVR